LAFVAVFFAVDFLAAGFLVATFDHHSSQIPIIFRQSSKVRSVASFHPLGIL